MEQKISNESGTFYVAPGGNDGWPGTKDHPFATLARARDALRTLRKHAKRLPSPLTVIARGGSYYLTEPLVLTEADAGTRENPVAWRAHPGETPLLSGGQVLGGWRPFRGRIMQAELHGSSGGKWKTRQLFCKGRRMSRARWPKVDTANPLATGWAFVEAPAEQGSTTAFHYRPNTFRHTWARPGGIEVKMFRGPGWNMTVTPVESVNYGERLIRLAREDWDTDVHPWYVPAAIQTDNRFCIENALEELDRPGEWCFDSEEAMLYFWPPSGDS
ncbi:MAG TPA: hypothetical protein VM141_10830, partial [Planctomycetota bacterium]|nr:hypothetical protein [Planctomycetota bacterium]